MSMRAPRTIPMTHRGSIHSKRGEAAARIKVLEGYLEGALQRHAVIESRVRAIQSNLWLAFVMRDEPEYQRSVRQHRVVSGELGAVLRDKAEYEKEIRVLRALYAL